MDKKFIIFDFDGTLADTHAGIVRTYQEAFRLIGKPVPSEETVAATIGLVMKDAVPAMGCSLTDEESARVMSLYREHFPEVAYPLTAAFPGVIDTLTELKRRGYRMAIATSRGHETLDHMVPMLGMDGFFEVMYAAEDVLNHKPAPDLVNKVLEKFGLVPDEVLVVGDATYDILMGHAAGCESCGIAWGNMSMEELSTAEPEYLFDTLPELLLVLR